MKKVRAVPEGFHTVTPYLIVEGADELIEFIKKAFNGTQEGPVHRTPDNKIMNAMMKIGNSIVMVSDTMDDMEPELAMLYLYVDDVDKIYKQAIDAKGESIREVKDEFYGDRGGCVKDRWGNKWWIATHKEDISEEELQRRAKASQEQHEVAR